MVFRKAFSSRKARLSLAVSVILTGTVGIFLLRAESSPVQARLVPPLMGVPTPAAVGFERATSPKAFEFPADHGAHPNFQTEWWYYTGNLETEDGRHFGYQLTFFRRALSPPIFSIQRSSEWSTTQVYLAHFAITDVTGKQYQAFERLSRGSGGLAGAQAPPFNVWLYDWNVTQFNSDTYLLKAEQDGYSLDLQLVDTKGPVLQGKRGYSQKGPQPGNASYYNSLTRLKTQGFLQIKQQRYPVSGLSWMDHEYSTSALSEGQVGWDWFALQLDDGSELMVFTIRREDGTIDPFSSGMLIQANGSLQSLRREDFYIEVLRTWLSPHSQAEYPAAWSVKVPSAGLSLQVSPYLADQELNLSYTYWEGAVQVSGEHAGQPVLGSGYVELTGYAGSFAGDF